MKSNQASISYSLLFLYIINIPQHAQGTKVSVDPLGKLEAAHD